MINKNSKIITKFNDVLKNLIFFCPLSVITNYAKQVQIWLFFFAIFTNLTSNPEHEQLN